MAIVTIPLQGFCQCRGICVYELKKNRCSKRPVHVIYVWKILFCFYCFYRFQRNTWFCENDFHNISVYCGHVYYFAKQVNMTADYVWWFTVYAVFESNNRTCAWQTIYIWHNIWYMIRTVYLLFKDNYSSNLSWCNGNGPLIIWPRIKLCHIVKLLATNWTALLQFEHSSYASLSNASKCILMIKLKVIGC